MHPAVRIGIECFVLISPQRKMIHFPQSQFQIEIFVTFSLVVLVKRFARKMLRNTS